MRMCFLMHHTFFAFIRNGVLSDKGVLIFISKIPGRESWLIEVKGHTLKHC